MSTCKDTRKFKTSEASTKAAMRTQGAIDKFLNITNLNLFRQLNGRWSKDASDRFDVQEMLFSEKDNGKVAVPNKEAFKAIDTAKGLLYQTKGGEGTQASAEVIAQVKAAADKMGINIVELSRYAKEAGLDITSVNGVADLTKGIIAVAQGKENVTLTEEMVHIATAILEQTNPELITSIISKIGKYKIYSDTLKQYQNNPAYQVNGKPDIRKIKKEAADKLIAELIVRGSQNVEAFPELESAEDVSWVRAIWNTILDYVNQLYGKSDIDLFKETARQVLSGEAGTIEDIDTEGVFYQLVEKNEAVDNFYDTVVSESDKLKLVPGTDGKKRHYTYDGQDVAKTVTEQVKGASSMPDRTPEEQIIDNQKRDFGSEGHKYIEQYISQALIDKDGYRRPVALPITVRTTLDPEVRNILEGFAKELINSYAPGTRFLIEKKVVNKKAKGMIASTIDFMAVEPVEVNGEKDIRVDILDWKFADINKEKAEDIPFFKMKEWKAQMGQYSMIAYNYGLTYDQLRYARMIPFIANYNYSIPGDKKSGLYLKSVQVGNIDSRKETSLYLLPVPLDTESTGNARVDQLIKDLRVQYSNFYKQLVDPTQKSIKNLQLNEFSKAIRHLHLRLDFEPLVNVGKTFLSNAKETIKTFENIDYSKMTQDEINNKLRSLLEFKESAKNFTDLDAIYLSKFPTKDLSPEDRKILLSLEHVASMTDRMIDEIEALEKEYITWLALSEEFVTEKNKGNILKPEVAVANAAKTFLEGSKLSAMLIRLGSNLILRFKSKATQLANAKIKDFFDIYSELEKEAKALGKTAFDMIGSVNGADISLIYKISPEFYKNFEEAKKKRDLAFLKENLDVEKYNELAKKAIDEGTAAIKRMEFSDDPEEDANIKTFRITKLKNSIDINRPTFNGYEQYDFDRLYKEAMLEEKNQSEEYKEMIKSPAAKAMWDFLTEWNEKAIKLGYLSDARRKVSFFPLMEASFINKVSQSGDFLGEAKDLFQDLHTVKINEAGQFGKVDSSNLVKQVPKYFTRTNREVNKLSRDLAKVGPVWIKSLLEYEATKDLENTLLIMHSVEKGKGTLRVDNNGVVLEGGKPVVDVDNTANADILQTIIDDAIYGLSDDKNSLGNTILGTVSEKVGGSEEDIEKRTISTKKVLDTSNTWMRALALGLKATITIPNYFGVNFQSFINSGPFYTFSEYQKNNLKNISNINFTPVQKGLVDLISPLSDDLAKEKTREFAWKEGEYLKWLSTWSFTDVMMSSMSVPEKGLQIANTLSFIDNTMVVDGKLVNIRQYLREKDREERKGKSFAERKALEKSFESRVKELQESSSIDKVAKIENDRVVIPGVSQDELAKYRVKVMAHNRVLNGQMNNDDKAGYTRDSIFKSFMTFKNWIPKMVGTRILDINKNTETGEWEYGKYRLFVKTWAHLGLKNVLKMREILQGTDEGLKIMSDILKAKKEDYFRKTGKELEITEEEFYDMMRKELSNQMKELGLLLTLFASLLMVKAFAPDDDEDDLTKNRYKYFAKLLNKTADEVSFYYNPLSFQGITNGSLLPQMGILTKASKAIWAVTEEGYAEYTGEQELIDKNKTVKYLLDPVPGISQFNRELLPILYPELAKELGIRMTAEARIAR